MRTATMRIGAALVVAAAGCAVSQATSVAQPAGQKVVYTLAVAGPADFTLTYLTAQPPSMAAYNADAYAYIKRDKLTIAPGAPWVFETSLEDPQWAFLQVSSATRGGVAAPNAHCEVTADGQVIVAQDHPYSPQCFGTQW
ncbi:hypothetical protein [Mycolicibacterium arseniciresistens]|uniref:Secreted protein n=1 Tax=Mycolicibacterium arseniciresistens TaxID=3062257 RepID=A0ABT8UE99_9MYCO|nr:hypothetical protein [Mycolicibacterium arseniciresistens]MDO3636109.1 hypothetical protein [Mycolicibacterium arseniciresistens]